MNAPASKTNEKRIFKLKPISKDAISNALEKAEQYRLLNQPRLAESICHDILAIDPGNQRASVFLLLALTDQFGRSSSKAVKQAQELASALKDEYLKLYYTGIIHERQATVALNSGIMGSDFDACEWYLEAMKFYEKADSISPPGNDDPVLRWNTCARTIMQFNLQDRPDDDSLPQLE
jgi:replication-associated recombination protein RarA